MLLLFFAVVPYLQSLNFGFVNYDDPMHVAAQPAVLDGVSAQSVSWASQATPGNLWHPLTWISYMAEVQWFGGGAETPGVHHGGNLLLYAITILFLYCLVRKLGVPTLWAAIGVLVFALHPLHAEPVAWISARKDLLSGVFILASLLGYVLSGNAIGRARWCWKSLSLLAFAAALLSKPSAVVLPALLIVLGGYVVGRLLEGLFVLFFRIETHIWRPVDYFFRTITARRNPNLAILTIATIIGRPDTGLVAVAAWTVVSLLFHLVRLIQAAFWRARGHNVTSWLQA